MQLQCFFYFLRFGSRLELQLQIQISLEVAAHHLLYRKGHEDTAAPLFPCLELRAPGLFHLLQRKPGQAVKLRFD